MTASSAMSVAADNFDAKRAPKPVGDADLALAGLRIVVVGINFAPELTGIGPYTTDLCRQLVRWGASVSVITGVPHYPSWSVPPRYPRGLLVREVVSDLAVTRARHYVPTSQSALKRALYEASFAGSALVASRRLRADLVLSVTPSVSALPVGAALAGRNAAPFGAIVQDLVGQAAMQSGVKGGSAVAKVVGSAEARWLRSADSLGVISRSFIPRLVAAGIAESRCVHLPNYTRVTPDGRDRRSARRVLGWPEDGFYVVHTGNIGSKQDLANVVAAARLHDRAEPQMRFVIAGDGSQRVALEKASLGVRCLSFFGPLEDADYPAALAAADVLLVNERASVKDMSLPSKLTSYFVARRPVLAATRSDGTTAAEVRRSGGGLVVEPGDPHALLEALHRLADDQSLREALAFAGYKYALATLSRERAEIRTLHFVSALARRVPAPAPGSREPAFGAGSGS